MPSINQIIQPSSQSDRRHLQNNGYSAGLKPGYSWLEVVAQMSRVSFAVVGLGCFLFLLAQFVRPNIPQPPSKAEIHAPPEVLSVLKKDCYSCHSNERRLAWFDEVEPAYWIVRKDVIKARNRLNFSSIGSKPEAVQKSTLYEAAAMMQLGAMPLPRFLLLHPESKVVPEDLATLKRYLAPWSSPIPQVAASGLEKATAVSVRTNPVSPSPNGLPYDSAWPQWKLLAITDRGDNRQFRMILGNDIAIKAAREGNVHPWPDGTRFAKAAWLQEQTPSGLIVPGKFWQVELMVKGANQYAASDGWAWARWRGLDLKPYGNNAAFVKECTGCHLPVQGNDYVYSLPFSEAHVPGQEVLNNTAASFPKNITFNPLSWPPITLYLDPQRKAISALFARDATMKTNANSSQTALVTWTDRDDPHWFGARIPDKVVSVETVQNSQGRKNISNLQPVQIP